MRTVSLTGLAAFVGLLAAAGCLGDAPHDNPLDPLSESYREVGAVAGQVTRLYQNDPVAGADVVLTPLEAGGGAAFVARTGSDGRFALDDVPAGTYRLAAEAGGYVPAADTVAVSLGARVERALRLDGRPVVTAALRTVHVSRWWPEEDLYLLEVDADVADPDGAIDVEAVWLEMDGAGFALPLQLTPVAGRFAATVDAGALPSGSLHAAVGQPFVVRVRDRAGVVEGTAGQTLARIIEETPVTASPQGLALVAEPRPVLSWEPAALPFPFTYRVDVVRVVEANLQTVVQTVEGLGPETTTLQVPEALPRGTYYWTLSVVDAFGNRSRSKEAGFQVE